MSLRDGTPLTISMRGTKVSPTVSTPCGNTAQFHVPCPCPKGRTSTGTWDLSHIPVPCPMSWNMTQRIVYWSISSKQCAAASVNKTKLVQATCGLKRSATQWHSCRNLRISMHRLTSVVSAMSQHEVVWHCQCQVLVRTDDLELAGEVVQDAAAYLGLADLESTAHFPSHMEEFQSVMGKVSTHRLDFTALLHLLRIEL